MDARVILKDGAVPQKDPAHQGGAITNGLERVSVEQPTTLAKVYMWIMGTAGIRRDQRVCSQRRDARPCGESPRTQL